MIAINITEFRGNVKKYLSAAENERLIIHSAKGKAFAVIPVEEVVEKPYNADFVATILQAREDSKKGLGKFIKTEDLWK